MWWTPLAVGVGGAVLRLAWVLRYRPVPISDFATYQELGRAMADSLFGPLPYGFGFTLGYPLFLSVFYRLGLDSNAVLFVQAFLGGAVCAMVAWLLLQRVGSAAAWLGGGLCAMAPGAILYTSILGSETACSFFLTASLTALTRAVAWNSPTERTGRAISLSVVAGVLLAIATAMRSLLLHLVPLTVVLLLVWVPRRSWLRVVTFCFAFYCAIWVYGEYHAEVRGYFRISARESVRLVWVGTEARSRGGWIPDAFVADAERAPTLEERDRRYLRLAVGNIMADPRAYLRLVTKKLERAYAPPMLALYWNFSPEAWPESRGQVPDTTLRVIIRRFQRVFHLLLLAAFVTGGWALARRSPAVDIFLWVGSLGVLGYASLVFAATIGDSRFQIPFIPIACVFIASSPIGVWLVRRFSG